MRDKQYIAPIGQQQLTRSIIRRRYNLQGVSVFQDILLLLYILNAYEKLCI